MIDVEVLQQNNLNYVPEMKLEKLYDGVRCMVRSNVQKVRTIGARVR